MPVNIDYIGLIQVMSRYDPLGENPFISIPKPARFCSSAIGLRRWLPRLALQLELITWLGLHRILSDEQSE